MTKWICPVCGYVHEGETAPEKCPLCGVPGAKFKKQEGGLNFVTEHKIGDGIVDDAEVTQGLKDHFYGECTEVGMYLAMMAQTHAALWWRKDIPACLHRRARRNHVGGVPANCGSGDQVGTSPESS